MRIAASIFDNANQGLKWLLLAYESGRQRLPRQGLAPVSRAWIHFSMLTRRSLRIARGFMLAARQRGLRTKAQFS
jgi:hypothetical protein